MLLAELDELHLQDSVGKGSEPPESKIDSYWKYK